ncbi:MAG: preprotein translocase subunit SecE [Zoogloeaceae bacterium]|jgi:preprotein translocase subunit SecE|nr:preprotein translocase subunit SecE [Zoogloeaceae bacterium]
MADKIKFTLAILLVAVGVAGFYLLSGQILVLRVLAVLAGVLLAGFVFLKTEPGARFVALCREAKTETGKVVWPSRKETTQTTLLVFGFVVIMALFLFLSDKTLEWVMYDLVLGWKKQ